MLLSESQKWKFHVVIWQNTSKNCTKGRATRAARFYFVIQQIISSLLPSSFRKRPNDIRTDYIAKKNFWSSCASAAGMRWRSRLRRGKEARLLLSFFFQLHIPQESRISTPFLQFCKTVKRMSCARKERGRLWLGDSRLPSWYWWYFIIRLNDIFGWRGIQVLRFFLGEFETYISLFANLWIEGDCIRTCTVCTAPTLQNVDYLSVGVSCLINISENISGANSPGKHNYSRHLLLCIY